MWKLIKFSVSVKYNKLTSIVLILQVILQKAYIFSCTIWRLCGVWRHTMILWSPDCNHILLIPRSHVTIFTSPSVGTPKSKYTSHFFFSLLGAKSASSIQALIVQKRYLPPPLLGLLQSQIHAIVFLFKGLVSGTKADIFALAHVVGP